MARQLVPVVTCDHCGGGLDPLVRTSEVTFVFGTARQTYRADLCDEALGQLEIVLKELQARLGFHDGIETPPAARRKVVRDPNTGRRVRKPMTQDDPNLPEQFRTCEICGTVSKTRQALGAHLKNRHDSSLSKGAKSLPR